TEQPTPKRLEDARKKGDAPRSQEIVATAMIAAGGLALFMLAAPAAKSLTLTASAFLDRPHEFAADGESLNRLFLIIAAKTGAALSGLAALFVGVALLSNAAQARPVLAADKVKPQLKRLSPVEGAKRLFGPTALVNFGKGVGKLFIVGAILIFALWPDRQKLMGLPYADVQSILALAVAEVGKLALYAVAAMTLIAALDYAWARREWKKRLMMTKDEVRREMKESEGDPQIKGRQRQQREARARRRMMAAVKDATVLIMNPTHYAVALKYDGAEHSAPLCVAKGLDETALRLRAAAEEHRVPVVENPPLARALYPVVEIDAEIPVEHYEAVAKVIGFVMGKSRARPL
ncbi:MAG TPA: flagellar biosynthesis protein FlhB, partial [Parvularculaceae bacterium]|nr:flagellar biosynthesis protein FlhB [Parvularculaceae bacterium]